MGNTGGLEGAERGSEDDEIHCTHCEILQTIKIILKLSGVFMENADITKVEFF